MGECCEQHLLGRSPRASAEPACGGAEEGASVREAEAWERTLLIADKPFVLNPNDFSHFWVFCLPPGAGGRGAGRAGRVGPSQPRDGGRGGRRRHRG